MEREENNIRLLTAGLVDGLLVASTMDSFQRFDALIPYCFPVVLGDRVFDTKKYSSVSVSNFQPIYRSVCRLVRKGDTRIGIIGGLPEPAVWILCIIFTLIWARIAAVLANNATPKTLNRATGVILVVLGVVVMAFSFLS